MLLALHSNLIADGGDGLAEGTGDSFDDSADVECEFHPVDLLKWKSCDPLAEFACNLWLFNSGIFPNPLGDTPVDAGAERFHEIVSEWGGAFSDDVADAEGGVEADGLRDVIGVDAPEDFGTFGFFGRGAAVRVEFQSFEALIARGDFRGEGKLVAAFRIDGFAPEALFELGGNVGLGAGEEGVGGAVGGKDERGGFKILADNQADS